METKTTSLIGVSIGILVAVLMLGTILVPVIADATHTTITITNEGAGELRYAYYTESPVYVQSGYYDSVEEELTIGLQTVTATDMIVWASDLCVIIYSGGHFYLTGDNSGTPYYVDLGTSYTVNASSSAITVEDSHTTVFGGPVTWSYVPYVDGNYGYFDETGKNIARFPLAAAGYFAGISTYNELSSDDRFELDSTVTDGVVEEVSWVKSE